METNPCDDNHQRDGAASGSMIEGTRAEIPAATRIHDLFAAQVRRTPGATAAVFEDRAVSYRELDSMAGSLASRLRGAGAGPEVLVGLCAQRSLDAVVGLLAILKAGAAYVPLDPAYPRARLGFMLQDAGLRILLTQRTVLDRLPSCDCELILLDDPFAGSAKSRPPAAGQATANNLAYVIYTSGSTGKPKGVAVEHRPLCNLILWHLRHAALGRPARTLQLASLSFDVSVQEVFSTWCGGGTLVLIPEAIRRDPAALLDCILRESVERVFLPFSSLQQLAVAADRPAIFPHSLREIVTAGEQLRITPEITALLKAFGGCALYNQYGPTETHVVIASTAMRGEPSRWPKLPPLGRPIANVRIYILDEKRRPVPSGEPGEIYVGGPSLARGYLNRPELTAERFVADPFCDEAGGRLYRTGDLARFRSDGEIEFLGRLDHQVKVRGFRIELGEIEAALDEHENVRQAAVMVREDARSERRLVAYLAADWPGPSLSKLRRFLADRLPEHMLPSTFVKLEALPVTRSGKIDRQALPAPPHRRPESVRPYAAPRQCVEERLSAIWAEVLELEPIGVDDDFFDLGGDSLRATRLLARVERSFETRFPHRLLFEGPTLSQMAAHLEVLQRDAVSPPVPQVRAFWEEAVAPLSFGQEQVWMGAQLHPELPVYNEPFAIEIPGDVNPAALERALNALVVRHEVLRTGFSVEDGRPVQRVHPRASLRLEQVDPGTPTEPGRAKVAPTRVEREARRPFDLSEPPLLRALLSRTDQGNFCLYLVFHHIVIDAVSVYDVLMPELRACYQAACHGRVPRLGSLPIQYPDFAVWQRAWLKDPVMEEQLRFWEERLADAPVLDLPADRRRPPVPSGRGAFEPFAFPAALTSRLKALARGRGVTLYVVLLAAFLTVLWRYSRQHDLVVGTVEAGRSLPELEPLLGYFLNVLVIRADLSGDPCFPQLLKRVQAWVLEAQAHKDYSFMRLVERLQSRCESRVELFRVAFVMEPALPAQESRWTVSQMAVQTATSKFDLTLELEERAGIIGRFEYASDLFDIGRIQRLIGHFHTLLVAVASDPERRLSELPLLTEAEHRQLREWNDTRADYPRDKCVHHLFEAQAALTANAPALVFGEQSLTYAELNVRANRVAHHLRKLGVGPDVPVGLYLERSPELVIGVIAVLKAGGAYVPLDPAYPRERVAFMLKDSHAQVILTHEKTSGGPSNCEARLVCLDIDSDAIAASSGEPLPQITGSGNLVYVIYTSGSTGTPKGVAVEHRSLVAMLAWATEVFSAEELRSVLFSTSICFDLSVFELFVPLSSGGAVVLADSLFQLRDLEAAGRVSLVNTVPSAISELLRTGGLPRSVRTVNLAGEKLSRDLVRRIYRESSVDRVYDLYGPSEDTVYSTFSLQSRDGRGTIGRPISNTRIYVLDRFRQPVPIGVPGELYIGGDGLARGYLNRPELTAERFVENPFGGEPQERLYRTGDRVRYLPDGNLEFLGRLDHQVKVRGYRIELGEIEAALHQHPNMRQAVTTVWEHGPDDKRLVAYVVMTDERALDTNRLRVFLKERLPAYMLPSVFVPLQSLPLTPNGKVNRKALPVPELNRAAVGGDCTAPRTPTEHALAELWREVLMLAEPPGIHDDFFDLGGHSLLATQLLSRIETRFGHALSLRLFFRTPTIEGLSNALSVMSESLLAGIGDREEYRF